MKKLLAILVVLIFALSLAACSSYNGCNKDIFDLTYNYKYAYIKVQDTWVKYEIKSWTDYEGEQLQVVLQNGTTILVSSINCILSTEEI